jgi:acetyl esterase
MRYFVDHYVRSGADPLDWRVSPLRAASLAGVAPAFATIATACQGTWSAES